MTPFANFCYDESVKKFLPGFVILFILVLSIFFVTPVRATTQQAYGDYLYQFDRYRQTYADFQRAKDTYSKYHSLTSQTQAVSATQTMMTQRNLLLRSYLLFLNEKLNEDQGQGNLQKEIAFLDDQNQQIAGLMTLEEATRISKLLETHYLPLQITIRQTIIGLTIGKLSVLSSGFDQNLQTAQTLVNTNSTILAPKKVSIINRWLIQIQNTRSLYQQQIDEIRTLTTTQFAAVTSMWDLDQKFADINKKFTEAQKLLTQMTEYLGELVTAFQYQ